MKIEEVKRRVYISSIRDSWFVLFMDRKPRQRWSAAQFIKKDHSLEKVTEWVKNNPKLQLCAVAK